MYNKRKVTETMEKLFKKKKMELNNSGAALITVIVVVGFISILATIILYVAGKNYFMKTTDAKIKDSFYTAETALETIRADLMAISNEAFQEAYADTMVQFEALASSTARAANYNEVYVNAVKDKIDAKVSATPVPTGVTPVLQDYLKSVVGSTYSNGLTITEATPLELKLSEGYVIVKGIRLVYTKNDFDTVIETDFIVRAPAIDWTAGNSINTWAAGMTTEEQTKALNRDEHDLADSVVYYKWEKK